MLFHLGIYKIQFKKDFNNQITLGHNVISIFLGNVAVKFLWLQYKNFILGPPHFICFLDTKNDKLGCVVRMFVDSILSHAEFGQNDHQKDAPPFRLGQSRSSRKRMIPKKADNPDSGFLRRKQTILRKQTIICSLFFLNRSEQS